MTITLEEVSFVINVLSPYYIFGGFFFFHVKMKNERPEFSVLLTGGQCCVRDSVVSVCVLCVDTDYLSL